MITSRRVLAVTLVAVALVAACKKKPETGVTPATNTGAPTRTPTCDDACLKAKADSIAKAAAAADAARLAAEAAALERSIAALKATLSQSIYYDYDQFELSQESRSVVDAKLPILRSSAAVRLRVSGHADERGSDEYNLALGQRRAVAVKRYLTDQGIDASRIEIVSFGEERPAITNGTEESFRLNRRADFEIIAGAASLTTSK